MIPTVSTRSRCDFEQMLDLAWGKDSRRVVAKTALPMCFCMFCRIILEENMLQIKAIPLEIALP